MLIKLWPKYYLHSSDYNNYRQIKKYDKPGFWTKFHLHYITLNNLIMHSKLKCNAHNKNE